MDVETEETLKEHLKSGLSSADSEYLAWKEQEIRVGLEESKDRLRMTPLHKILKEFGLEH